MRPGFAGAATGDVPRPGDTRRALAIPALMRHLQGMLDRRRLLGLGAAAAAAPLGLAGPAAAAPPQIQRYVTLGRTGLEVSEISFGSASSSDPELVRHALDARRDLLRHRRELPLRLVGGGDRRGAQGRARPGRAELQDQGRRRRPPGRDDGGAGRQPEAPAAPTIWTSTSTMRSTTSGGCRTPNGGSSPSAPRQQGKIRFRGMSGHGSRLAECLDYARRAGPGRRRAGRLQLRPGPGLLRPAAPHLPLRRAAARAAARAREGQGQGCRRDRDEDADGRAPQRHAALRERRQHLRPGGLPLGPGEPAGRRRPDLDDQHRADRRVRRRLGRSGDPAGRPRSCSSATPRCRAPATAGTAATPARAPAPRASRSPRCCARGCTRSTTATRRSRSRTTPSSARGAERLPRPARTRPASAPARSACRSRRSPAMPPTRLG